MSLLCYMFKLYYRSLLICTNKESVKDYNTPNSIITNSSTKCHDIGHVDTSKI